MHGGRRHPRGTAGSDPRRERPLAACLVLLMCLLPVACAQHSVSEDVIDRYGLTIKLRSWRPLFGDDVAREFQHPVAISAERLTRILGAIEVELPEDRDASLRGPRAAVAAEILEDVASGLAQTFARATADQEIVVMALRKRRQHGIFNRKFLTSFVTYVKDERLFVLFSRIKWKTNQHSRDDALPEPQPGEEAMNFRMVVNGPFERAGRQGVSVDWRDPIFDSPHSPAGLAGDEQPRSHNPPEEPPAAAAPAGD